MLEQSGLMSPMALWRALKAAVGATMREVPVSTCLDELLHEEEHVQWPYNT